MPILEALSVGTPVVTLPSLQPQTRLAAGVLATIGVGAQCVASTVEDFAAKAVALATDSAVRMRTRQAIEANVHRVVGTSAEYASRLPSPNPHFALCPYCPLLYPRAAQSLCFGPRRGGY